MYKPSDKELLELRKKIFLERGIPALEQNGFKKSPFSTAWYGRNNLGDYTYELCRLSTKAYLEVIKVHIVKGDKWIQIYLNIFELHPKPKLILDLNSNDGIKFDLPPNSLTKMRLKSDDIRGIPLFNYHFLFGGHKLRSFNSEKRLNKRSKELGDLVAKDLTNIDDFIKRWHELHRPNIVDWEGNKI